MSKRSKAAALTGALVITATSISGVLASSHREAPMIAGDPYADLTDVYAFVSPDKPDTVTFIAIQHGKALNSGKTEHQVDSADALDKQ